jgi:hypothetical protein
MSNLDYIRFDVHKKSISYCAKAQDGRILDEGKLRSSLEPRYLFLSQVIVSWLRVTSPTSYAILAAARIISC